MTSTSGAWSAKKEATMAPLIKTRTVLHAASPGSAIYLAPRDSGQERRILLDLDPLVADALGRPTALTVTIEPGDRLNGDY